MLTISEKLAFAFYGICSILLQLTEGFILPRGEKVESSPGNSVFIAGRCLCFLRLVKCGDVSPSVSETWQHVCKAQVTVTGSHPSFNVKVLFVGYSKSELTLIFKTLILWQGKALFEVFKQLIDTSQQDPLTKSRISPSLGQALCQCLKNITSSENALTGFCLCSIRATWKRVPCVSTLCTPSEEFNKLLKSAFFFLVNFFNGTHFIHRGGGLGDTVEDCGHFKLRGRQITNNHAADLLSNVVTQA